MVFVGRLEYSLSLLVVLSACLSTLSFRLSSSLRIPSSLRCQTDEDAVIDFIWGKVDDIPPFKGKVKTKSSLKIKELSGGNTNFNYVVHNTDDSAKTIGSIFVKHAKPFAKGFGESAPMSTVRLGYEFDGVSEFSKYGFTTLEAYLYCPEGNYLVTQYLDGSFEISIIL